MKNKQREYLELIGSEAEVHYLIGDSEFKMKGIVKCVVGSLRNASFWLSSHQKKLFV